MCWLFSSLTQISGWTIAKGLHIYNICKPVVPVFNVRYYSQQENMEPIILPNSREKILTSATECFFQHGYAAANISMISRYVKISRVTIHKQFKSKEALFRAVVEKHITENHERLRHYEQSSGDFWAETQAFTLERCGGLFDEVSSTLIRTDLLHAGQTYCEDIIQEMECKVRECIKYRILKELDENRMTLDKIAISVEEFSRIIESAPFGLAISSIEQDNQAFVKNIMKVFKASTMLDSQSIN